MSVTYYPPLSADRPARLVVLASGGGSNLAALLQACGEQDYGARVLAVVTDRAHTGAQALAEQAGIAHATCRVSDYPSRAQWDLALSEQVASYRPDLVISAGFLKLCGPEFLTRFAGRYLNTHNSLLPAFPGIHGPRDALSYGVKVAGATLFFVDEGIDTGIIIAQTCVPVEFGDSHDALLERIKVAERAQLVETIGKLCRQGWTIAGRQAACGDQR